MREQRKQVTILCRTALLGVCFAGASLPSDQATAQTSPSGQPSFTDDRRLPSSVSRPVVVDEAKRRVEEENRRASAEAEAKRQAELDARRASLEAEAKRKTDEEAQRMAAEADARRKSEEETKRVASEADAKRRADEEIRRVAAESEARKRADEEAKRLAAVAEAKRRTDEEAKRVASDADAKRRVDDEAKRVAAANSAAETKRRSDEEAARVAAATAAATEAKRRADEEATRVAAAAAAATAEAKRRADEEAARAAAATAAATKAAAEVKRKAEDEAVRAVAADAEVKRKAEAEAPKPAVAAWSVDAGRMLTRGRQFLTNGDVDTARVFFERAAEAGNADAAREMGATFDPAVILSRRLLVAPEPGRAKQWYERADALRADPSKRPLSAPAVAFPQVVTSPVVPPTAANSDAARYLARGRILLKQNNIVAARAYFERSADDNSAEAAIEMARTFDPAVINAPGSSTIGVVPDPAIARTWYQRAEKLGATGLAGRIQQLSGQ